MILVVDDEVENRSSLVAVLTKEGWNCCEASNGLEALELIRNNVAIKLLITDLKMPGSMDGLELLQSVRLIRPDVQRLLVTAFGTIEDTVQAMRAGAFDVLSKPLKAKTIRETVARLLERAADLSVVKTDLSQMSAEYSRVLELLRRAAPTAANVLFAGESGSGKSYLAHILHDWSDRKQGPFVVLNCAAIPSELLESELFGTEKGAYTGASHSRDGIIQSAHGGTLLLDEIGDLSLPLQAKLLQFIQTRRFFKLGSNKEQQADVRILSATNRPLADLTREGKFREDLLYRLKVVEIRVPSLRERRNDLLWLVPNLLEQLCEKNHLPPVRLTHQALSILWNCPWPGNIRELENKLESALVLAAPEEIREGFLTEKAFEGILSPLPDGAAAAPVVDLATFERNAIRQTLAATGGNKKLAANLLGISERTLYRFLEPGV